MEWIDYATAGERKVLARIEASKANDNDVKRRIYDRCRKRMKRERETAGESPVENR